MNRNVNFWIVVVLGAAVGSFSTLAVMLSSIFFTVLAIIAFVVSIVTIFKRTPIEE